MITEKWDGSFPRKVKGIKTNEIHKNWTFYFNKLLIKKINKNTSIKIKTKPAKTLQLPQQSLNNPTILLAYTSLWNIQLLHRNEFLSGIKLRHFIN